MVGYIYCSTCLNNNKKYIGQTIRNYNIRWNEHKRHSNEQSCKLYNCHFYRAIRKYGWDSFKWEILETIECENLKDLRKQLDLLEIEFISKYDSFKNGYNSTPGGDHSVIDPKSVLVFSDKGELLNSFENAREASEYFDLRINLIQSACGRFTYYTRYNNQRLIFRWYDDTVTKEDLDVLNNIHYDFPVEMYDINGNFIESFSNITDAAIKLNIKNERISSVCRKQTSFVLINGKRFIFIYKGDILTPENINKVKSIKSDPKVAVVAIDSITKEILGEFLTQNEGAKALDTHAHNISEVINGKRKSAGKYNGHPIYWERKPII